MKKILTIIMFMLFSVYTYAQNPSKEETVNWLKAKSGVLLYARQFTMDIDYNGNVNLSYPQSGGGYTDIIKVDFSKVTAVSYNKQPGANGMPDAFMISLGGKFASFYTSDSKEYKIASNISLSYTNVDENEIKRIVKAYEHLATLCGAKVVKDDLFKN